VETPIAILHLLPCLIDSSGWQDGVPETIKLLRNAGINVWMLTGDKQNTAIQIGLLCNLITSGTVLLRDIWYPLNLASGHLQLTIRVAFCKCFLHWSIAISCPITASL